MSSSPPLPTGDANSNSISDGNTAVPDSSSSARLWQLENEVDPSVASASSSAGGDDVRSSANSHTSRWAAAAAASAEQDDQESLSASASASRRGRRAGVGVGVGGGGTASAKASAEQDDQDSIYSSSSSRRGPGGGGLSRSKSQRSKNQRTKMKRKGLAALEAAALGGASSSSSARGGGASASAPALARTGATSRRNLATNIRDMERQHGVSMRRISAGTAGGGGEDSSVASSSADEAAGGDSLTNLKPSPRTNKNIQHGMMNASMTEDAFSGLNASTGADDLERMHNKHASLELHELAEGDALQKSSKTKGKANKSPSSSGGGGSGGLGIASPEEVRNRANFLLGLDTTRGSLDGGSRQQLIHGSLPDRHVSFGDNRSGQGGQGQGQGGDAGTSSIGSRAASLARAAGRASAKLSHKLRRDINNLNQPSGEDGSHSTYFDDEYDFAPSESRLRNQQVASRFNMADEELGIDIAPSRARFTGKRPKLAVAGTLLLAAVVAFAYNVFWGGGGGGGNAGGDSSSGGSDFIAAPQGAEQQVRLYEIRQRIRDSGMKDVGDIDCLESKWESQPPTPQCKAVNWLALKDPMKVATDDEYLLQRYALACFWYSTFGLAEDTEGHDDAELHYWTEHSGWMTGAGVCSWEGIICHHKPGTDPKDNIRIYDDNNEVTHLRLPNNSIRGAIPDEVFSHLTELRQLDLSDNSVTGTISASIGRLKFLQYLYLYNNVITGDIPDSIGDCIDLREIDASNNALSSTLPSSLGQLRSLSLLGLFENHLSGTIPSDALGSLGLLEVLYLDNNKFEGTMPESLLNLPKLYDLRLNKNVLTGTIPETQQGGVLELLYLDSNKLTGFIPPSISRHSRMASLRLFSNQLIGAIPSELSALTSLDHLSLEFNQLQGSIPHELMASLSHLSEFYIQGNAELSGSIPTQIGELADLKEFRAHDCSLTGSIPSEIGQLFRLTVFDVSNNKLSSTLPDLSQLEKLTHLKIGGNRITGVVDNDNCELTKVSLEEFSADCAGSSPDIVCACCTECL